MQLLTLLTTSVADVSDIALSKLALYAGIEGEIVPVTSNAFPDGAAVLETVAQSDALVLSLGTIEALTKLGLTSAAIGRQLGSSAKSVLVVGRPASTVQANLVHELSDGAVTIIGETTDHAKAYTFDLKTLWPDSPLHAQSFTVPAQVALEPTPLIASSHRATKLMTSDEGTVFVSCKVGLSRLFFLFADSIPDIDTVLPPSVSPRCFYPTVLPILLFLRFAFREQCWTNPFPSGSVIIDDPLLHHQYGFVHFESLLKEARNNHYAITLAFIPFNYNRSDQTVARLLAGHPNEFSLCVHGCDHTGAEFAQDDQAFLFYQARQALRRVKQHEQITGLSFDSVMVFPKGKFCTSAVKALKMSHYTAAANSTLYPSDWEAEGPTIKDLLSLACTRYHGFPIFQRRYPVDVFDFAVDLFLGRPAIIVAHHQYFRKGCKALTDFVHSINSVCPAIQWMPLGRAVSSAAWYRKVGSQQYEASFCTPNFLVRNPSSFCSEFTLCYTDTAHELIENATVEGRDIRQADGQLFAKVILEPGQRSHLQILYKNTPDHPYHHRLTFRLGARCRRYLSEFRDNYLSKCVPVLAAVEAVRRSLLKG